MEELCLVMGPACFPHAKRMQIIELSFEPKEQPSVTEEQVHVFIFKHEMGVELCCHHAQQFFQVKLKVIGDIEGL
jgi:hypothetical protein